MDQKQQLRGSKWLPACPLQKNHKERLKSKKGRSSNTCKSTAMTDKVTKGGFMSPKLPQRHQDNTKEAKHVPKKLQKARKRQQSVTREHYEKKQPKQHKYVSKWQQGECNNHRQLQDRAAIQRNKYTLSDHVLPVLQTKLVTLTWPYSRLGSVAAPGWPFEARTEDFISQWHQTDGRAEKAVTDWVFRAGSQGLLRIHWAHY